MKNRPEIPEDLKRKVLIEAGHRCAIPTCRHTRVEIAHIVPWSENEEHKFENLIALCPNCHDLYDKDKKIDRKSMHVYKQNLGLLNSRYGEFERRVLHLFCINQNKNVICLSDPSDILLFYLLKDGLLEKTGKNSGIVSSGIPTWEEYRLTSKGKDSVENLKQAHSLV